MRNGKGVSWWAESSLSNLYWVCNIAINFLRYKRCPFFSASCPGCQWGQKREPGIQLSRTHILHTFYVNRNLQHTCLCTVTCGTASDQSFCGYRLQFVVLELYPVFTFPNYVISHIFSDGYGRHQCHDIKCMCVHFMGLSFPPPHYWAWVRGFQLPCSA